jgi:ribonucleoside-diphosphate reductase beta chain
MSTIFNKKTYNPLIQPMFLGESLNIVRYDQNKHSIFEKFTETQLAFFWRPEEVNCVRDKENFAKLLDSEKHIFISNLQNQITLDSIQGRSPVSVLLPCASLAEIEVWLGIWGFFEMIHSRSYTHIIRSVFPEGADNIFGNIMNNKIIMKNAYSIAYYYDNLHYLWSLKSTNQDVDLKKLKKALYLALHAANALESIRFCISFAISFAFLEENKMVGSNKIIQFIARDEALHHSATRQMINLIRANKDDDPEMTAIALEQETINEVKEIFRIVINQEKNWVDFILKDIENNSILGLNKILLYQFVDYIAENSMFQIGLLDKKSIIKNPLSWYDNYLKADQTQLAPQEVELTSYLSGQIDNIVNLSDLKEIQF